jgi:serine/arginine repetitive matrix protein 2
MVARKRKTNHGQIFGHVLPSPKFSPSPLDIQATFGSWLRGRQGDTGVLDGSPEDYPLLLHYHGGHGHPTTRTTQPRSTTSDLPEEEKKRDKKPLTLSDIIPPPSHVRTQSLSSLMEEDDSVLKSIFANAADIVRPRVNSDSSARRFALDNSRHSVASMHSRTRSSRPPSGICFTGFDSFDEVRRGFEFPNNSARAFYPPPVASNNRRVPHARQDSLFSIASVSSYGHVTNPGINDPFEYGLPMPSLRERPSSEDLSVSMSINVDDTFSFLGRSPPRKRVESDASSFYFKAPAQPSARGHRRRESNMSVSSQGGPPISFYNYNRSFGNHRLSENDTSTSGSSLAHTYAAYGANGGRAAWAKHRQDSSMDSVLSEYSVARLGRPGVGDKMFDTAVDHGMPLRAISASPPESRSGVRNRSSFDSILDDERRSSTEDSLFEKTGHRSSMSSDSVFGYDDHHPPNGHLLPPAQFRPLSMLSIHNSVHSPMKEDDTMISVSSALPSISW